MYDCDKNQVPYYNVKGFKNEIFDNFGPSIEHGPHWINIIIYTFISEKIKSTRVYIICNQIIPFDMKKMGNLRQVIGKVKKNYEFESFKNESLCFKSGTLTMLEFTYNQS
jgi:hypothetical protein